MPLASVTSRPLPPPSVYQRQPSRKHARLPVVGMISISNFTDLLIVLFA